LWIMQLELWITVVSLRVPLDMLVHWPKQDSPDVDDKYDYLDQDGELYCNPKVVKIFQAFCYHVLPTGSDSSYQTHGKGLPNFWKWSLFSPHCWCQS
jgi:hypothetical protein